MHSSQTAYESQNSTTYTSEMLESFDEHWIKLAELGRGDHGQVFLCIKADKDNDFLQRDSVDQKLYAVKKPLAGEPISGEHSLKQEINMFLDAKLDSRNDDGIRLPHIAAYDDGEYPVWMAMPFIRGILLRDLETYMKQRKNFFPRSFALHCFSQLATAIKALHDSGVVHGDIAPHNVMIDLNEEDKERSEDFPDIILIDLGNASNEYDSAIIEKKAAGLIIGGTTIEEQIQELKWWDVTMVGDVFHGILHGFHGNVEKPRSRRTGRCFSKCPKQWQFSGSASDTKLEIAQRKCLDLLHDTAWQKHSRLQEIMERYGDWIAREKEPPLSKPKSIQQIWDTCESLAANAVKVPSDQEMDEKIRQWQEMIQRRHSRKRLLLHPTVSKDGVDEMMTEKASSIVMRQSSVTNGGANSENPILSYAYNAAISRSKRVAKAKVSIKEAEISTSWRATRKRGMDEAGDGISAFESPMSSRSKKRARY